MRIRTQLSLFTALVLLASIALGWQNYRRRGELIERNLEAGRLREIASFAEVCRLSITLDNPVFMKNYIRYIRALKDAREDIVFAYFVRSDWRIQFHTDQRFDSSPFTKWEKEKLGGAQEVLTPILINGRRAGTAVVGFSGSSQKIMRRQTRDQLLIETVKTSALAVLAGIVMAIFFFRQITRPLQSLMRACEKIRSGDFNVKVNVNPKTELGELAEQFNTMASRLAILDELKDRIISNVSHDLRGPLHGIKLNTEYLLLEDPEKDKIVARHRNTLATILQETTRLSHYINNILDAAKIKAGRMEYHLEPVDIKAMTQGIFSIFEIMAMKRKISLELEMPQEAPWVLADQEQFRHVLINLISNALKFTPPQGRVVLRVETAGEKIRISVIDTGSGIPPEDLPLLFTRFKRADAILQRTKQIQGTGLGLHIVKESVEAMGGKVEIQSQTGKGSTVTVTMAPANIVG